MTLIEHFNMTVPNIDAAIKFIRLVAPDFTIRKDAISEGGYRWAHIGNDNSYIALQEPHLGCTVNAAHPTYRNLGVNHIGLIIEDAVATEAVLLEQGYKPTCPIMVETHRKRIYFYDHAGFEWEMVQYTSDSPSDRYLYE